jgi:hypothetical protein
LLKLGIAALWTELACLKILASQDRVDVPEATAPEGKANSGPKHLVGCWGNEMIER